jgi:hypothetical protein
VEEEVVAYFKVLSDHVLGRAEENHKKSTIAGLRAVN